MRSKIEDDILKILFKGEVISRTVSKMLVPDTNFCSDGFDDISKEDCLRYGYKTAQESLEYNIQELLK